MKQSSVFDINKKGIEVYLIAQNYALEILSVDILEIAHLMNKDTASVKIERDNNCFQIKFECETLGTIGTGTSFSYKISVIIKENIFQKLLIKEFLRETKLKNASVKEVFVPNNNEHIFGMTKDYSNQIMLRFRFSVNYEE